MSGMMPHEKPARPKRAATIAPSECSLCLRPSKLWNSKMKLHFKGADRRYQYLITAKVRSIASAFESHVPATLIHRP